MFELGIGGGFPVYSAANPSLAVSAPFGAVVAIAKSHRSYSGDPRLASKDAAARRRIDELTEALNRYSRL